MADKDIYIEDSPKNPDLKTSPFDWTYTTNLTGRFGKVNCAMMKYLPPHTKFKVKPYFGFDMQPLVFPVQTNVRCHLKFYKVPLRILWKDFEDFASQIGTNGLPTNGGGTQFVVPYIKRPTGWNEVGSLAEQIGCCNRKLIGVTDFRTVTGSFIRGSLNGTDFMPTSFEQPFGSQQLFFNIPGGVLLDKKDRSGFNDVTLMLNYTSNSSQLYGTSYAFTIRAFIPSYSDGEEQHYDLIASTVINSVTGSQASFNSSSSSIMHHSKMGNVDINGITLSNYLIQFKIVSNSFFSDINSIITNDTPVYFSIEPNAEASANLFPSTFSVPQQNIVNFNRLAVEQTGDVLTYKDATETLYNSLGCLSSVQIASTTVGSEIDTKFDSIEGADPAVPIPALPFRALEFIHNYFMRNPRIDPFVKDGVPTYNRFLTNDGSGADSTTPVESWNALYESDYFTTCVKEPQFGNAPLVGATVNDTSDTGILTFGDGTTFNNYVVKLNADVDGNVAPLSVYPDTADKPTMDRLNELINFGISINDLRNVSTFQRMLERMQRTSYRFANVVYEFFGTNPPVGDHYPQYLGGVTRNITVNKITNIAESEGHPLGKPAGQGFFNGEGETISLFTTEPCYLVCIQYFTVTPTYSQYLPKHLLYKNPLDFYMNPEFAFMGPQPVYKGELAPNQISAEHFYDVFGYNRPYAELFGNVDEVHGLYKTDMANYLLQRFFGDAPQLNKSFIEINSADLTNIFSVVKNTDKLFGQIMFKGTAQLPAPRSYLPRSI